MTEITLIRHNDYLLCEENDIHSRELMKHLTGGVPAIDERDFGSIKLIAHAHGWQVKIKGPRCSHGKMMDEDCTECAALMTGRDRIPQNPRAG